MPTDSFAKLPRLLLCTIAAAACSPSDRAITVPVAVKFGSQAISCVETEQGIGLSDFRAFVHGVKFKTADGRKINAKIVSDPPWQNGEVALLDFENGQGSCSNGNDSLNQSIRLSVPAGEYVGISFQLGVPEHLNHANPLIATAPLNMTPMHWHWRSGYKFMRVGVDTVNDGFWMHLGSARCRGTIGNIEHCASPNRVTVRLDEFRPGAHAIVFDLQALTAAVDLQDGIRSNCSSGPAETACVGPFAALGIEFDSGRQIAAVDFVRIEAAE